MGYIPDYPAADQNHLDGIALPYVVYRGDFLRAGDKGIVRGRFIKSRNVELDVSLSGSFPVESDDNDARRGMPDLDYLAEVGPRLQWTLARAAKWAKIELELPVRAVFSTDFSSIDHQGFLFAPELAYQHENFLESGIQLKLGLGASFADEDLQGLFLRSGAPLCHANPARLRCGRRLSRKQAAAPGAEAVPEAVHLLRRRQDRLPPGRRHEESPLFRDDVNFGIGAGLIWSFYQSERMVDE